MCNLEFNASLSQLNLSTNHLLTGNASAEARPTREHLHRASVCKGPEGTPHWYANTPVNVCETSDPSVLIWRHAGHNAHTNAIQAQAWKTGSAHARDEEAPAKPELHILPLASAQHLELTLQGLCICRMAQDNFLN
jgi:hypothetical protein